ncbi:MAG: ferrochelatase [Myxococcota bacterium]
MPRAGVLLINLGTPASPRVRDVRRYLRQFLLDPRVIDIPGPLRWLLVEGSILPFRPRRSAALYRSIWTDAGSPLLVHSRALERALRRELGDDFRVALGMRYGDPTVPEALASLEGCSRILAAPLYPQYATSSTESALDAVRAAGAADAPVLPPFFADPGFLESWVEVARPALRSARPEHVLMSFHGLPERQIRKLDGRGEGCLERDDCCESPGRGSRCYRAQCFATARTLAPRLGLGEGSWSVSFQSRLGRTPWIRPFTVERLGEIRARGVRRLAVMCPSFVADCLETLEEIGIRARAQWEQLGGETLALVPCLNAHPRWVRALAEGIRRALEG